MSLDLLEGHTGEIRDYSLERLIMLSDGVFAIAATLLTLELRPPPHWGNTLAELWAVAWRPMVAYLVSFTVIGAYWMAHKRIFSRLRIANTPICILGLITLGMVGLLPVTTNLLYDPDSNTLMVQIYILHVGLIGVALAALFGYAAFVGKHTMIVTLPMRYRVVSMFTVGLMPGTLTALGFIAGQQTSPAYSLIGWTAMILAVVAARRLRGPETARPKRVSS